MATENKNVNYTPEQEKLIRDAIADNGGVADGALAEKLAGDSRMNGEKGPRDKRSIIAKMTRMDGVDYKRAQPTTKNGQPVQKKLDLVARIAKAAGVDPAKLDGLEKSPKLALETLAGLSFAA